MSSCLAAFSQGVQAIHTLCLGGSETSSSSSLVVAVGLFAYLLISKVFGDWELLYHLKLWYEHFFVRVPLVHVEMSNLESKDAGTTPEAPPSSAKTLALKDRKRPGYIQCYCPSTKQYLGQVVDMTAQDVHELCVKAKAAQVKWAKTTFTQRRQVLRTMQKYLMHHAADICRVSCRDSGKPKLDAMLGEILTTCEKIRCLLAHGELWLRPSYRTVSPIMIHKTAVVEYVPFGIIAPIAPWNYPFHNFINHILSGIFAGNAVVGKVSEHTSWSSQYFGRIVQECLAVHGHDPNLCQTITGTAPAGQALVTDPLVDKIIFTGSPGIGRKVMEAASHHLKPVVLELGGKDAFVVMDDCTTIEKTILPFVMRGVYQNCGQNCVGVERVLVYESLYQEFCDKALSKVKELRQGIPLETCGADADIDCAAMVMEGQIDLIQSLVDDAVKKGATLLCGGKRNTMKMGDGVEGQFYLPTILADVTPDMRIFQEEVFGPVMTIVKVPDDDDAKCLDMINGCPFGLGCSIFGNNKSRALKMGRQVRSGMMCINDFSANYLVQSLPFGGVGESGFGRFAGPEGLRELCLERSILLDRIPGVRTTIPACMDYPINKAKAVPFAESIIHFFYDESILGKIKGIFGLIKNG